MNLLESSRRLRDETALLAKPLGAATHALNPLVYAWQPHQRFIERHGPAQTGCVWVGMNPGPWGMMQTGIPFGAIPSVRDYLGIQGTVDVPEGTHPKRPIEGFATSRVEVSGTRLWGAISAKHRPAEFFARHWILTYCPIVWQVASGANLPPDKLPVADTVALFAACDARVVHVVRLLRPRMLIGIGVWAERQVKRIVRTHELPVQTGRILHPSPASPLANKGWAKAAEAQLEGLGHPL